MSMKNGATHEELGNRIMQLRKMAGFSKQSEFAAKAGVKQQTVSRWEAGASRPSPRQLSLLADLFSEGSDSDALRSELLSKANYKQNQNTVVSTLPLDQSFPLDILGEYQFENFCTHFLEQLHPAATVHRYGDRGHKQEGLDIMATFPNGDIYTFQCKRLRSFGPGKVTNAVVAHTFQSKKKFILLSRVATPEARKEILKHTDWDIWDKEDISRKIRQDLDKEAQRRLVDTFFPGHRFSLLGETESGPWQTPDEFFAPFMHKDTLINHAWELVGRKEKVKNTCDALTNPNVKVVFISGTLGAGKTRILKEVVEKIKNESKGLYITFISSSENVTRTDLDNLGKKRKIIVIDDAHDRKDLPQLFQHASIEENNTTLLLSLRPYGLLPIESQASKYSLLENRVKKIEVGQMCSEDAERLALQALTLPDQSQKILLAKELVELAENCPLEIVIGARVLSQESPTYLGEVKNSDNFQKILYSKFQDVYIRGLGTGNDQALIKKLLTIIAFIQPFYPDDDTVFDIIKKIETIDPTTAKQKMKILESAGVLIKRGNQYRIYPAAMTDFILEDSCVGVDNVSSGYAETVFDIAAETDLRILENVVLNISVLDWRLKNKTKKHTSFFNYIWGKIQNKDQLNNPYSKIVASIAPHQPERALNFVEHMMSRQCYGSELIEVVKLVARDQKYTKSACECLWELGKYNQYAIEVLSKLGEIEPNKLICYSEIVADFALGLVGKEKEWSQKITPLDVLSGLMKTEGLTTKINKLNAELSPFHVSPQALSSLRRKVVNSILELLSSSNIKAAAQAAKFLRQCLHYPLGMLGNRPEENIIAAWEKEFIETLSAIKEIVARENLDPLVLVCVAESISWHLNYGREKSQEIAAETIALIPNSLEYRTILALYNGHGHILKSRIDDTQIKDWENYIRSVADDLLTTYQGEDKLRGFINSCLLKIETSQLAYQATSYALLFNLIKKSSPFAQSIIESAIQEPDGLTVKFTSIALANLFMGNHDAAIDVSYRVLDTKQNILIAVIPSAYAQLNANEFIYDDRDIKIIKKLLSFKDKTIVENMVYALRSLAKSNRQRGIELIKEFHFDISNRATDDLLFLFHNKDHIPFNDLAEQDVKLFLQKLTPLAELKGYALEEFLAKASKAYPVLVKDFFIKRMELGIEQNKSTRPCNYGPFAQVALRFKESSQLDSVLLQLKDWIQSEAVNYFSNQFFCHHIGKLFSAMFSPYDEKFVSFLQNWMEEAQPDEFSIISLILAEAQHEFTFEHQAFVIELLEKCKQVSNEVLDNMIGALFSSAISGGKSGTPGAPYPRDEKLKKDSEDAINALASRFCPAHRLYNELRKYAEQEINFMLNEK